MNKRGSHWSDDPRFKSKEHYDAVMSGRETHKKSDFVNDVEDTDRHAAGLDPDRTGRFIWNLS